VRKRELEVLGEELLNVWALYIIGLLDFDDLEDLFLRLELIVWNLKFWISDVRGLT
jgi:hypothetical protein